MKRLLILLAVITLAGCSDKSGFGASLKAAANRGSGSVVAFRDLTKFEWDTVYVYGPYHPLDDINKRHKLNLSALPYDGNSVSEGECLYLFTLEGKVVEPVFGPRYCGGIIEPGIYPKDKAVFQVEGTGPHWDLVK